MYVKLFSSLYQGTLRGRTNEIMVFTNLLAHADQYGIVDIHWKAISEETGLSEDQVRAAILNLESPDAESRSPECNGCRIVRTADHRAWGWQVVNYMKYRAIKNEDDRREQNRLAQERWRNKHKDGVSSVSTNKQRKPIQKQKQIDIQQDQKPAPSGVDFGEVSPQVVADFTAHRKAQRAPITQTALDTIRKEAGKAGLTLEAALAMCCARGWRGFKADWVTDQNARTGTATAGKTMQGIQLLERMKNGLADPRDNDRLSETSVLRLGAPARR